jgi:hypothetical protein
MKSLKFLLLTVGLAIGLNMHKASAQTVVVCQGQTKTLTASGTASSYQWFNDGTLIPSSTTQSITVSDSGHYTVELVSAQGCTSAPSTPVVFKVAPALQTPTITASGNSAICAGSGTITLTASAPPTTGVPAGVTYAYAWYDNGTVIPSQTSNTLALDSVSQTGSYTVSITTVYNSTNLCSAMSAATPVTINAAPAIPTIQVTGASSQSGHNAQVCQGNPLTLTATSTTANVTFQWYNASGAISGATSATLNVTTSDSYYVIASTSTGCSQTSATEIVTVNPLPATPTIQVQ